MAEKCPHLVAESRVVGRVLLVKDRQNLGGAVLLDAALQRLQHIADDLFGKGQGLSVRRVRLVLLGRGRLLGLGEDTGRHATAHHQQQQQSDVAEEFCDQTVNLCVPHRTSRA